MLKEITINVNIKTGESQVIEEKEIPGEFEVPESYCKMILKKYYDQNGQPERGEDFVNSSE